jgi:hypothetical protein
LVATPAGKEFATIQLTGPAPAEVKYIGQLAGMRVVATNSPRNRQGAFAILQTACMRPGALDYLAIPSLMAGERVPHHVGVVAADV